MIVEDETKCSRNHLFVIDLELKSKTRNKLRKNRITNIILDVRTSGTFRNKLRERVLDEVFLVFITYNIIVHADLFLVNALDMFELGLNLIRNSLEISCSA